MSKNKNKVIKPVGFNVTKEDDMKMLNHVKRRNFSGYVKKLILADIEAKERLKHENEALGAPTKAAETIPTNLEMLKQKMAQAKKQQAPKH